MMWSTSPRSPIPLVFTACLRACLLMAFSLLKAFSSISATKRNFWPFSYLCWVHRDLRLAVESFSGNVRTPEGWFWGWTEF